MYYCGLSITNKDNAAVVVNDVNENYRLILDFTCDQNGINKLVNDFGYYGINNQNSIIGLRFYYDDTKTAEDYQRIYYAYYVLKYHYHFDARFLWVGAFVDNIKLPQKNVYEYYNAAFKIAIYVKNNYQKINRFVNENFEMKLEAKSILFSFNPYIIIGIFFFFTSIYLFFIHKTDDAVICFIFSLFSILLNYKEIIDKIYLYSKKLMYVHFNNKCINIFSFKEKNHYWNEKWKNIKSINRLMFVYYPITIGSRVSIEVKSVNKGKKGFEDLFEKNYFMEKLEKVLNFYMYNFGNNKR